MFQNEASTAKEFVKIMEAAENDYQVCKDTDILFRGASWFVALKIELAH